MGFSHVHSPDSLSDPILSQVCILEMALSVGTMGRMYIPRTGELVRYLIARSNLQIGQWSCSLGDLL